MCKIYRFIQLLFVLVLLSSCKGHKTTSTEELNTWLDQWHLKASKADTSYFEYFDADAVFIGTDPEEVWNKSAFKDFAMPFFIKGKAWDFKKINRNIYVDASGLVWFDELLDTWMGKCRASGVIDCSTANWKIKHYQLSMAIPNDVTSKVIRVVATYQLLNDTLRNKSEAVVGRQLDAYNEHDIDGFVSTFHPDAELYSIGDPKPRASGINEVKSIYDTLLKSSPQLKSQLLNRIVLKNKVIDHEYITGRNGNKDPLELVMVYELDSNLIRRAWSIR